ncbi:NAD(P)H-binding protein [Actinocrispum sp. NPDC049592]|uniref:SDR family oxidoreductase n=1 Tax=Actinocrispum sp. NPDC049592 TaxID=3154835 RepID=UPI00343120AD
MFLVTGATGNVGRHVVSQLLSHGPVRALSRTPGALPSSVEACAGGLEDISCALDGVSSVFLMWPFHSDELAVAVVAALRRRVRRVVFLSSGAAADPDNPIGVLHRAVESALEESGLEWTHLRPSTFAANTLWWAPQIRGGDVVRGPYGCVRMALLHEADIASVAVRALVEDTHHGKTYALTGPEALSQVDQVRIIGAALGRPLRWEELDDAAARAHFLADPGFPREFVEPLLAGYASMVGSVPVITTTVEDVTGVPARSFSLWAAEHRSAFMTS